MSTEELKKEIHALIDDMENEAVLSIVKEKIIAYQNREKEFDDLSDLTDEERAELEELASEDPLKDTISEEEHKKEMKKWLSKLSRKKDTKII